MPAPDLVSDSRNPTDPVTLLIGIERQLQYVGQRLDNAVVASPGRGFIPIDLLSARGVTTNAIVAPPVEGSGNPILERINAATDKGVRITWAADDVAELQLPTIIMPPDLDDSQDVEFHFLMGKDGSSDSNTVDVQVFDGVGDTEMGGTVTPTAAISELVRTITAANIAGHPLGFLNAVLLPGTHANDAVYLYAAWFEYAKI